jgi:hypothetical protein
MQACRPVIFKEGLAVVVKDHHSIVFYFYSKKSFLFVKKSNLLFTSHRVSPRPIRAPGVGLF